MNGKVSRWCVWTAIILLAPLTSLAKMQDNLRSGVSISWACIPRGGDDDDFDRLVITSEESNNITHFNKSKELNNIAHFNNSTELRTIHSSEKKTHRFSFLLRLFRRRKQSDHESGRRSQQRKRQRMKNHTTAFTLKMNEKLEETRRMFLDSMAAVSFTLINQEHDATMSNDTFFHDMDGDDEDVTPQSDLSLPNRSIYVVTTAALPWRTG